MSDRKAAFSFILAAVTLFTLMPPLLAGQPAGDKSPLAIRTITYNIRGGGGHASTDRGRARFSKVHRAGQVAERLAMELKLYQPDIVTFQEAASEKLIAAIAKEMDFNYAYFPGGWKGKGWPEGISGALITRFEILEQENCPLINYEKRPDNIFSRHFGRVLLQAGTEQIAVYSTHMLPSWKNTTHIRENEIKEILAVMAKDRAKGRSILVQGDLNHTPDTPEYDCWLAGDMIDTFKAKGAGPVLTCPSDTPTERIDYIWATGPIAKRISQCRVLFEGAFRTNPADEHSFALSDHVPVLAIFE